MIKERLPQIQICEEILLIKWAGHTHWRIIFAATGSAAAAAKTPNSSNTDRGVCSCEAGDKGHSNWSHAVNGLTGKQTPREALVMSKKKWQQHLEVHLLELEHCVKLCHQKLRRAQEIDEQTISTSKLKKQTWPQGKEHQDEQKEQDIPTP